MSILTINPIVFAQDTYEASSLRCLTFPTAKHSTRDDFLALCKAGEYDNVVAINRHLHDKSIGRLDAEIIAKLPKSIKLIANIGAGYDQIDVAAATKQRILVCNTPNAVRDSTADTALFLILGTCRNFGLGQYAISQNQWIGDIPRGRCPSSQKLGVLGLGSIGAAVIDRVKPLGMSVQYHNRKPSPLASNGVEYVDFNTLLRTSDVILVSVPLNANTRHLLGTPEIAQMKRGVVLVNIARGAVVDEEALIAAQETGHIRAVGLDVYEDEPHVPDALKKPQSILLPHMGTHSIDAGRKMECESLENIEAFMRGKHQNVVPEQKECQF